MSVSASAAFQAALEPWTTRLNEGLLQLGVFQFRCGARKPAGKPHVGQDGILLPIGNRPVQVFIPFHELKAHADSQDWLPHQRANVAEQAAFQAVEDGFAAKTWIV